MYAVDAGAVVVCAFSLKYDDLLVLVNSKDSKEVF